MMRIVFSKNFIGQRSNTQHHPNRVAHFLARRFLFGACTSSVMSESRLRTSNTRLDKIHDRQSTRSSEKSEIRDTVSRLPYRWQPSSKGVCIASTRCKYVFCTVCTEYNGFSLLNPPMAYGCLISCPSSAFFSWFIHVSTYLNPPPSFVFPDTFLPVHLLFLTSPPTPPRIDTIYIQATLPSRACACILISIAQIASLFYQPLQSVMDLAHLTTPASNNLFPSMTEDECRWMHNIAVAFLIISFVLYHTYPGATPFAPHTNRHHH
ncbi:hypothetical protein B0H67DRAFT_175 [Lasiosphaeris hirsuta]|uniref:Uncharacterized protein n=1 Tax=Lasiosphaeris hirsuta TaxID=260670 RepID=A0AA40E9V6_9PEZI|nr:hypothetical protein B0H67DRAFT_175 [Lasiosphaeris hirsuta]